MAVPVHRGVAALLKALLNPRLLMVYALLGGSAIRGWRQRRWRKRRRERRQRDRAASREVGRELQREGKGTDEE